MELVLGEWLKQRRRSLNLTQGDLASRSFCSIHTIRKIETGDFKPSQALALEIARALDLGPDKFDGFVRFARTPDAVASEDAFIDKDGASERVEVIHPVVPPPPSKFHPPAPITAALGRTHDIAVILRVLRLPSVRLVTLTGPPGTGKTRLGLEVAAALQSDFEYGAAFVPLAPLSQNSPIENAIAQVLRVNESSQDSLTKALVKFLRDKEVLLVLDNFEHLLTANALSDAVPPAVLLVTELLTRAPRLKILATSREPLRVYGERELPIQPLSVPPLTPLPPLAQVETFSAVQLFVERAQAANPEFDLNERNLEAVARLCARLDGLPLAIEMAAARVKWDAPQALLPQLTRGLELFKSSTRDQSPRQQTLRGAIRWSYDLLDETEQRVFRHLGVFRGSFSAEAARAVCGFPVQDILGNLLDKSLVKRDDERDDGARLILLEMIREYALEQLIAAGEAGAAQERHWSYFLALARQAQIEVERGQARAVSRFKPEYDNARHALDWAIASGRGDHALTLGAALAEYRYSAYGIAEGVRWLAQVLAMDLQVDDALLPARARVRLMYADYLRVSGDSISARPLLIETIQECRAMGQAGKPTLGMALAAMSRLSLRQGDFEIARATACEALDLFVELNDPLSQGGSLRCIAEWALNQGEYAYARESIERAIELQHTNDNYYGYGVSIMERGDIARAMGDYARAHRDYVMAHQENKRVQDKIVEYRCVHRLGIIRALMGDPVQGQEQIIKAVHLAARVGANAVTPSCYSSIALCEARQEHTEQAMWWLGAMDRQVEFRKTVLVGPERLEYEQTLDLVRTQASAEQLAAWRAQGKEATAEQVMTLLVVENEG